MKNWKTTLAGVLAGLLFIIPVVQQWLASGSGNWRELLKGLVLALLGIFASDGKATGQ